jgi:hypothetical protein
VDCSACALNGQPLLWIMRGAHPLRLFARNPDYNGVAIPAGQLPTSGV